MLAFTAIPPDAASDPTLRADLLATWAAVTDAGGAVGFTPPAPLDAIGATLDAALIRVGAGVEALGVMRAGSGAAVGMGLIRVAPGDDRDEIMLVVGLPTHSG